MATLVRQHQPSLDAADHVHSRPSAELDVEQNIPKPFPTAEEMEQEELLDDLAAEELDLYDSHPFRARTETAQVAVDPFQDTTYEGIPSLGEPQGSEITGRGNAELVPSIMHVQRSCLTTLNDLLSTAANWRPIIPDRRHSLPARAAGAVAAERSTSALHTIVHNLRAHDSASGHARDLRPVSEVDDTTLVRELQQRVEALAQSGILSQHDSALAQTLVSLITNFQQLSGLHPDSAEHAAQRVTSWDPRSQNRVPVASEGPSDSLVDLKRQLSDLQLSRGNSGSSSSATPFEQVQTALLWESVDKGLEHVLTLCRERSMDGPRNSIGSDNLPPEYDAPHYDDLDFGLEESLPQYDAGQWDGAESKAGSTSKASDPEASSSPVLGRDRSLSHVSEKMRMDLETVTLAIERLYLVAPQLHDQRVELKKSKLEQMEKARRTGPSSEKARGKQRAKEADDAKELEKMVELIGKASQRKLVNQAVVLEDGLKAKLEKARQRDMEKRDEFVTQLVNHSAAGRLHSQDAVFPPPGGRHREKDPDALLSLPEFMREAVPEQSRHKMEVDDPRLLGMSASADEASVGQDGELPSPRSKSKARRSRSLSAPSMAWLLPSRSSSPTALSELKKAKASSKLRRTSSIINRTSSPSGSTALDVRYVAEYHENLQHVLIFLDAPGLEAGAQLEAEVVSIPDPSGLEYDYLVLKCGSSASTFLNLPARVVPGKKELHEIGGHYQVKLPVITSPSGTPIASQELPASFALLDAEQLLAMQPSSFVCTSCSLPLVQSSQVGTYRDLPSEHWAELVDAWMCHSDQKLHEHVSKHTTEGFRPTPGCAFVGGSYVLFEESAMVKTNFWPSDQTKSIDGWHRVRCLCGAVVGRYQLSRSIEPSLSTAYRIAKYAIRPVSPNTGSKKIPLSAFIAEDMIEFVHAHATYRFVIFDEEEERPRILMWLFRPMMRLAYSTPAQYVIPKNGSIQAAKVLFKILNPTAAHLDLTKLLNKYPGFPQAEHIHYPIDICRRLGNLLKESNTAYPDSMRTMTSLNVGWLQRA